ncbi:hypothetical protein EDB85DRAFT_1889312 [Lactarius pseudohatsudake]|nr:hypothetical protein EDB85DRAFT_1889312 [Lactarius pseudohatsudake]
MTLTSAALHEAGPLLNVVAGLRNAGGSFVESGTSMGCLWGWTRGALSPDEATRIVSRERMMPMSMALETEEHGQWGNGGSGKLAWKPTRKWFRCSGAGPDSPRKKRMRDQEWRSVGSPNDGRNAGHVLNAGRGDILQVVSCRKNRYQRPHVRAQGAWASITGFRDTAITTWSEFATTAAKGGYDGPLRDNKGAGMADMIRTHQLKSGLALQFEVQQILRTGPKVRFKVQQNSRRTGRNQTSATLVSRLSTTSPRKQRQKQPITYDGDDLTDSLAPEEENILRRSCCDWYLNCYQSFEKAQIQCDAIGKVVQTKAEDRQMPCTPGQQRQWQQPPYQCSYRPANAGLTTPTPKHDGSTSKHDSSGTPTRQQPNSSDFNENGVTMTTV